MAKVKTTDVTDESGKKVFISKREFWTFGIAAFGQAMIYGSMSNYISDYYLNVLLLSPWFVLLLMLLARVWDAINDPIMGIIADKYTFKKSKYKPYILFSGLPIAVLTFFMFFNPGITSRSGLMAFNAVIYVLWGMVYTMSDVPFWSLPNVMTPDPDERGKVFSFARTLNGIGSALPILMYTILSSVIPKIRPDLSEVEQDRLLYLIVAITMSVLGICLYITAYFNVKERVLNMRPNPKPSEPETETAAPKEKGAMLKRLFSCKPLMLVVTMGILSFGRYLMQAAAPHVARYAFIVDPIGDITSKTIVNIVIVASAGIGMFGSMLCMPALYKRFNYKQIVVGSCILGFLSSIVTTVLCALVVFKEISWLFYVCIPLFIIQSIPLGVLNVTSYAMVGDCLDYLEYTTGYRDNALGSAVQGFVNKIGNCFATCFVIIMYLIVGLNVEETVKAAEVAEVLTKSQQFGMSCLVSIVPGLCLLLCAIPIFFYDLVGDKKKQVTAALAERRGFAENHDPDRKTESIELINELTQNQSAPESEE